MNKILSFFKKDIFIFILVVVAVGFYFRKKTKSLSKQNYALYREYFVLQDEQKILNEYKKMEWKSNGLVLDDIVFEDKKSSCKKSKCRSETLKAEATVDHIKTAAAACIYACFCFSINQCI